MISPASEVWGGEATKSITQSTAAPTPQYGARAQNSIDAPRYSVSLVKSTRGGMSFSTSAVAMR